MREKNRKSRPGSVAVAMRSSAYTVVGITVIGATTAAIGCINA